ncbi:MAG: ribosome recycling factor [Nitrospinae bacterium]|nr:ribosome recycling factor [Nitrospinota bacterium]
MEDLLKESERKINVSLDHLRVELGKLRTGRASLMLVEDIKVDYFGNPTPLNEVSALANHNGGASLKPHTSPDC